MFTPRKLTALIIPDASNKLAETSPRRHVRVKYAGFLCINVVKGRLCLLKPPCMIAVSCVLPAIRAHVARQLVDESGMKPAQVATRMGVTPPAITQYLTGVRGREWTRKLGKVDSIARELDGLVEEFRVTDVNETAVLERMCRICRMAHNEGLLGTRRRSRSR
jgi:predicted transcriptional regulator